MRRQYNGTKAFIDSFSWALRNELKDSGVTVTCLMPGPTDTEFFQRANLMDTRIGAAPATTEQPKAHTNQCRTEVVDEHARHNLGALTQAPPWL